MRSKSGISEYKAKYASILVLCFLLFNLFFLVNPTFAQRPGEKLGEDQAKVLERDKAGKATKLSFFNIVNADIHSIIKFMSDETNLTIIASEKVKGKVTVVNLKEITVDEALEALKTALNTLGFTTIRVNRTIVIIPLDEAKTKPVRVQIGADPEKIESTDEMITQIIPLTSADAVEMSQNLKNLVAKTADMFADVTSNSLVITDTSSNIHRIALILKELDTQPGGVLQTQIFQLRYANATNLTQTLNTLFQQGVETARQLQRMSSRSGGNEAEMRRRLDHAQREHGLPTRGIDMVKGLVYISSDDRTNKLIVTASEENMEIINKMIEELDTSDIAQAEIKVFLLGYAVASEVATQLEDLLQGGGGGNLPPWERWRRRDSNQQSTTKGLQGTVNIISDERLNAVIVSSDPQNFPLIESIIEQLDQEVEPQEVIHIFMLTYADAETIVQNLEDLFQGADADLPWWERDRRRRDRQRSGESDQVTGIQGTVNLVAETRLNAVVASTAAANIPILEGLIKKLDITVPDLETDTRVFPLVNADAENLAEILSNIYRSGQQNQRFWWMPQSSRSNRGATVTGTITVAAYPRTNSLIVTTTSARNFEVVAKMIEEMDKPTPLEFKYSTLVYPLEYSNSDDMQDLLNDIFSEQGESSSSRQRSFFRMMMTGQSTMQKDMSTLAGQVRVNADTQTNALIIMTPERNFDAVRNIIRQLDIVRGQVWLDITVLEVTLGEDNKLGLEWSWKEGNHFGKSDMVGEFGTSFQLDQEGIGFAYKVFNKNLTALLHTLMRENRVKVLSAPSMLTRDNQEAILTKGKDIPYLQSTRTDQYGNLMYDYDFLQDIGINIRITPHIAKQGIRGEVLSKDQKRTIGLDIQQINVSSFLEYTDFNAPITSDSTVTTYVDVADGEQIAIGGMMKTETKSVVHQIPILGSIPFLGRLFKKTEDINEDTELLILITPHIIDINSQEDRDKLREFQGALESNNHFNDKDNDKEKELKKLIEPSVEMEEEPSESKE